MGLWDKKNWKIDQPIGVKTEADQRSINIERHRAQFLGKEMRDARRNKDLEKYLLVEAAGYKDRGIENVDDKNRRFLDKVHQDRFQGDRVVGVGQQPAEEAQQPFGGEAMGNGRGTSPRNAKSSSEGSSGGQWVNTSGASSGGTQPLPPNTPPPTGTAQPATPAMSAAEQSKQATLEKTLAGNFGKVAQARAQAKQSGGTYDATPGFTTRTEGRAAFVKGVQDAEKQGINWQTLTKEEQEAFLKKGKDLGLTEDQIGDVVAGYGKEEGGLSPASIAKRVADRKKSDYNYEFEESDKKWAELVANAPEKSRAMLEGLSPQEKKESIAKAAETYSENRKNDEANLKDALDTWDRIKPSVTEGMRGLRDDRNKFVDDQNKSQLEWSREWRREKGLETWDGITSEQTKQFWNDVKSKWGDNWKIGDPESDQFKKFQEGTDFYDKFLNEGKFKKDKADPPITPQASINIGKIQGAYEKASRGADDILFGLSFDQRKV